MIPHSGNNNLIPDEVFYNKKKISKIKKKKKKKKKKNKKKKKKKKKKKSKYKASKDFPTCMLI